MWRKALFAVVALPAVARAALRAAFWVRRLPLDDSVARLRRVRRFRAAYLRHPDWLLGTVDRGLRIWPPWGYGRCLKRSLLLLDLWGRCGLEPRLHLGVRSQGSTLGHAWVSCRSEAPGRATASGGYPDLFEL